MLTAVEPAAPRSISLVSRSATSLAISWERPADTGGVELLGYKVYVADGSSAYQDVPTALSAADPTILYHEHVAADLTPGHAYKFRVAAYNLIGEGEAAQLRTEQPLVGDAVDYVLAADLPEAPLNPPSVTTFTETAISLTLEALDAARNGGSAVTGYLVEIDDGLGGSTGAFRRVHDSLAPTLIISNLAGGRTYNIRYSARNQVSDSGNMFGCDSLRWSPVAIVLTAVRPSPPSSLRQVTGPDGTGRLQRYRTKLAVEWDPMSEAALGSSQLASFTLALLDIDGTGLETEVLLPAQAHTHTFETLLPGRAYTARIKATNLVGESDWTGSTGLLYPGVEPTRPGLITFTATTRTSITYAFAGLTGQDTGGTDAVPIPTTYRIYMSTQEATGFRLIASPLLATPQTAEHLSPGVWHYFRYQAENSFGLLSEFSTVYKMMPGRVPSAPAGSPQLIS